MSELLPDVLRKTAAAYHSGNQLLLLFDYDGTLAPLAAYPWLAQLPARTRELLACFANLPRVHVGVLSGRRLDELEELIDLSGLFYSGLSGIELNLKGTVSIHPPPLEGIHLIDEVARRLGSIERVFPGAWVEHKHYGFTVHYRGVAPLQAETARRRILRFLDLWTPHLRILEGPQAVEVTVEGARTKGDAVRAIKEYVGDPAFVFYAGDAANDREAFAAALDSGGVALGVEPRAPKLAVTRVASPLVLVEWLAFLLRALRPTTVAS
jgi:trehalose 6-phosphate phosphatase